MHPTEYNTKRKYMYDIAKLHNSGGRKTFCLELKNIFEIQAEDETSGEDEVENFRKHLDDTYSQRETGIPEKGTKVKG